MVYVKWRDASHDIEERLVEDIGLAELEEIGFLQREDEELLVISCENQEDNPSARLWIAIPKVNITERRNWKLSGLLKRGRRK